MKSILNKLKKSEFHQMAEFLGPRQINLFVNISVKDRYVWFKNPKVASSTLSATFEQFQLRDMKAKPTTKTHPEPHNSAHIKPFQLGEADLAEILSAQDYCRFAFVRNPYARLVSAYSNKILGNKPQKRGILKLMGAADAPLKTEISFPAFLEAIKAAPVRTLDSHWLPQVTVTGHKWFNLDFIGRLETFSVDFDALSKKIAPSLKDYVQQRRKNQTGSDNSWQHHFIDPSVKRIADTLYAEDFEAFQYTTRL